MRQTASVVVLGLALIVAMAAVAVAQPESAFPRLVDIRAAHHPGFDRIVFEFAGGLPERTVARWSDGIVHDPSGLPVHVQGRAFIQVDMSFVTAHEQAAPFATTYGARSRAFDLPNFAHVVAAGHFEAVVSFWIGLMKETRILRTARLRDPS